MATKDKFTKGEYVQKEELRRVKERVNAALEVLLKMHEETINRDSVVVESLLDTQLGKLRRLIVKKGTHEDLKMFADELNEPFEWPDILLPMRPPAAWNQIESAPMSQATRTSSKKMNSTMQHHARTTSIGRRPSAGRRGNHSGSRSSHSRNSSRNKRQRQGGSGKRRR